MDCIITAGGVPQSDDLLFSYTQGGSKALLPLAGKPMVQWVLDALTAARQVDRIVVVGLKETDGVGSPKLAAFLPDQGSLLKNVTIGIDWVVEQEAESRQILLCSADIPLISAEMVDEWVTQCNDPTVDLYYGVVGRALMERVFPASNRSYVHFSDGDVAGADIFVVNPQLAHQHRELWDDLIGDRKSVLKQARRFGIGFLLRLLLRRVSIRQAEEHIERVLNLTGRVITVAHAELGMDVDKPFQLEICEAALAAR
jgi:molybdopterin-guanine dinucleotide biosynthesis protein A